MKDKFDHKDKACAGDEILSGAGHGTQIEKEPFRFSSSFSAVDENGKITNIDTSKMDNAAIFYQNYKYWNRETGLMSTNNFDNLHFAEIVKMGTNAVPFILKEIEKTPSQLVHALDLIFPGVMKYEGFVSLDDACEKWISILK